MNSDLTTTPAALTGIDHKSAANFSLVEVRMDATRFPRVRNAEPGQAVANLRELVVSALLFRGLEQDKTTVEFIAANLYGCIMQEGRDLGMENLSWYEIARIVRRGALDGSLIGVSVSSLFGLLRDYCRGEGHDADVKAREELRRREAAASMLTPGQQAYLDAMAGAFVKDHKTGGGKR